MVLKLLALLALGFGLGQDNFRTSIALGPLRLGWRRAVALALWFGLWDGAAPLAGWAAGHYAGRAIGSVSDYVGPIVVGTFGLYLLVRAARGGSPEGPDYRWAVFGLPLPLSIDNFVAGTGLGLLGVSPWISAATFAAVTALMSFVGLQLGRVASYLIRVRHDLLAGAGMIIAAVVLGLGL